MSIEDCIDLNSLPYFTTLFIEQLGQPAAFRIMRVLVVAKLMCQSIQVKPVGKKKY